ncbi:MAG: hypothetical protein CH104c_0647 [Candidatus Woesebacteria bacterium]|nr:MAG: hypothetical protein CH104c_0647 [Candidatus Woesebacteria bacterium]
MAANFISFIFSLLVTDKFLTLTNFDFLFISSWAFLNQRFLFLDQ